MFAARRALVVSKSILPRGDPRCRPRGTARACCPNSSKLLQDSSFSCENVAVAAPVQLVPSPPVTGGILLLVLAGSSSAKRHRAGKGLPATPTAAEAAAFGAFHARIVNADCPQNQLSKKPQERFPHLNRPLWPPRRSRGGGWLEGSSQGVTDE